MTKADIEAAWASVAGDTPVKIQVMTSGSSADTPLQGFTIVGVVQEKDVTSVMIRAGDVTAN